MTTYTRLYKEFYTHLNEYIQANGPQNILQVKQIAKNYAIQSRQGRYDVTARKRYCSFFISYCWKNNIPTAEMPEGWDIPNVNFYDPDNEFPNDPHVRKLMRNDDKRRLSRMREMEQYMQQRQEEERIRQREEEDI